MKILINYILFLSAVVLISCSGIVNPESTLEFGEYDLYFTKSGGWINPSGLNLYKNGNVIAVSYGSHGKDTTNTNITSGDQKKLSNLLIGFEKYDRHYEPSEYWTDQNYETIILVNRNISDTVSAYNRPFAKLPVKLNKLFNWLNDYYAQVTTD